MKKRSKKYCEALKKVEKSKIYTKEEELIDKIIEDITNIRNLKVVNEITKDAQVQIESKYKDIYTFALKLNETEIQKDENIKAYNYKSNIIVADK